MNLYEKELSRKLEDKTHELLHLLEEKKDSLLKELSGVDKITLTKLRSLMDDYYNAENQLSEYVQNYKKELTVVQGTISREFEKMKSDIEAETAKAETAFTSDLAKIRSDFEKQMVAYCESYLMEDYTRGVINRIAEESQPFEVVQETGDSTTQVMSQDATTRELDKLSEEIADLSDTLRVPLFLGIYQLRGSAFGQPLSMVKKTENDRDVSLLYYLPSVKTGDKINIKPVNYPSGKTYYYQFIYVINGILDSVYGYFGTTIGYKFTAEKDCDLYISFSEDRIDLNPVSEWGIIGCYSDAFAVETDTFDFGYYWSVTPPTVTYDPVTRSTTLSLHEKSFILTKAGLIETEWTGTLTTPSRAAWVLYDADTDEYRLGYDSLGHKCLIVGLITYDGRSWIGGTLPTNLPPIPPPPPKTFAFLGDSITAGSGTRKPYHMVIAEEMGHICKNYGYGGSGYLYSYPSTGGLMGTGQEGRGEPMTTANQMLPNDFLTRIKTIPTTIDGLVIFGGTNDFDFNIPLDDFATAVDNVLSYALTNFTGKQIIVVLPFQRLTETNETGLQLTEYVEIIKTSCKKYSIPCIDAYSESGVTTQNTATYNHYFARDDSNGYVDGIHPNKYAHKNLARMIEAVIKTFD